MTVTRINLQEKSIEKRNTGQVRSQIIPKHMPWLRLQFHFFLSFCHPDVCLFAGLAKGAYTWLHAEAFSLKGLALGS